MGGWINVSLSYLTGLVGGHEVWWVQKCAICQIIPLCTIKGEELALIVCFLRPTGDILVFAAVELEEEQWLEQLPGYFLLLCDSEPWEASSL